MGLNVEGILLCFHTIGRCSFVILVVDPEVTGEFYFEGRRQFRKQYSDNASEG